MRFGEILLEFLSQKNMTQDQLARELEVSSTLVNRWINKKDIAPSINRCREIAKILKLTREEENKLIEASVEERLPDEFRFL
ncbi:MAG: helix-turn-helix transcriptional regulator, partial [Patescibacteria group bacterium]